MKTLLNAALLFTLASSTARAQINAGNLTPQPNPPFTMTQVATFDLPWRIAFLPDGRMLVTEKVGPIWLVTQQGQKTQVENVPAVLAQGQGGMLGVFVSPHYATDHSVYLTYSEPGDVARARARDSRRARRALKACRCCGTTCRRVAAGSSARRSRFHPTVSICSSPSAIGSA